MTFSMLAVNFLQIFKALCFRVFLTLNSSTDTDSGVHLHPNVCHPRGSITSLYLQARNQDFMWGGANETKADPATEMYFLSSDPFI